VNATTYRLPLPRWDIAWEVVQRTGRPVRVRKVWDVLHLNARPHWRARHRATIEVHDAVLLLGRAQRLHHVAGAQFVHVVLVWAPGDRRRADPVNLTPLVKACSDALSRGTKARPGLGVVPDDDDQHMTQTVRIDRPPQPPGLWLEVTVEGAA
jgi:hypothetical protein